MKTNHARLATLKPDQMLQTKAFDPAADPILQAVADHAKKFEDAAAASALEVKSLNQTVNDLTVEVAALKSNPSLGIGRGGGTTRRASRARLLSLLS